MFMSETSKLSINKELLQEEFIELLRKEGLITKEISFVAKKLVKEEEKNECTR